MATIFISYRRDDTAGWTRHLASDLETRFGRGSVFLDIDRIAPGDDFVSAIERTLAACSATLVVIGPGWLDAVDRDGRRRLDDPQDLVRQEIGAALRGPGPVIPVLVGQASMPAARALPDELKPLARRQAFELSDTRRGYDLERLCTALEGHVPRARLRRLSRRIAWVSLAAAAAAVVLAALWFQPWGPAAPTDVITIEAREIVKGPGPFMYQYFGAGARLTPADGLAPRHRDSKLRLFEDGVPLPEPHAGHEDIATMGRGRYSHWNDGNGAYVNFSTLNPQEDPRTNGRAYTIRVVE